jgi:gliding motility-associated peptidyl-prolyl isomerase
MKKMGLLFFLIYCCGCSQLEPREPLNKKKTQFLENSAQRNKKLLLEEERLLFQSAQNDSLLNFQKSDAGYLYAYIKKAPATIPPPKKGDKVRFQYQIEDLQKTLLYDKSSLGIVDYAIDVEELLPALREGLRIMKPNEVVVFLFPSYLCYSYQGDGDKIGINQPLRFTIERINRP